MLSLKMSFGQRNILCSYDVFLHYYPIIRARHNDPLIRSTTIERQYARYTKQELLAELEQSKQRLDQMEQQLRHRERLAALGQMVAGIAHELNHPLTSVIGYAERLARISEEWEPARDGERTAEERLQSVSECEAAMQPAGDYARKIAQEAERATHFARNLLVFASAQKRDLRLLSANNVVCQTVGLVATTFGSEIHLTVDLDPDIPCLLGNECELQQVLINLITNARQAIELSGQGSTVKVSTRSTIKGGLELCVEDDGPGIPPEQVGRLMEPFFTTKAIGKGTGLGLAIASDIVRAHGTTLQVYSEPGQGARFWMEFSPQPQTTPLPVEASKSVASLQSPPAGATEAVRPCWKVAIIDDEPTIRELLTEILTERGYQVYSYQQAATALQSFADTFFDMVLCDIRMLEMTGLEFYDTVRERSKEQAARIIFVTGDIAAESTQATIARSGNLILRKPFRHVELMALLEEFQGRIGPSDADSIPCAEDRG